MNVAQNSQNNQAGVKKVVNMVEYNTVPKQQISTNVREVMPCPASPTGSVVSISSDEDVPAENSAMDYEEVDIEF